MDPRIRIRTVSKWHGSGTLLKIEKYCDTFLFKLPIVPERDLLHIKTIMLFWNGKYKVSDNLHSARTIWRNTKIITKCQRKTTFLSKTSPKRQIKVNLCFQYSVPVCPQTIALRTKLHCMQVREFLNRKMEI